MALHQWQIAGIQAAASFMRKVRDDGDSSPQTKTMAGAIHEGLLEVMDPARRARRMQQESSSAIRNEAAAAIREERRRQRSDRRTKHLGSPTGVERRSGTDRRREDRRNR